MTPTEAAICGVPIDCPPVNGVAFVPYKNSEQVPCLCCGRLVWVGPESLKLYRANLAVVGCPLCLLKGGADFGAVVKLTDKRMGE